MKTMSTFPLPTLLLLLLILGQFPTALTGDVNVTETGVYIITMICDPNSNSPARSILRINDRDTIFIAYGSKNVRAGLSVALPFNVGDTIGLRLEGDQKRSNFSLGVALASTSKKYFTTVHSDGYVNQGNISFYQYLIDPTVHSEFVNQGKIGFYQYITESGSWSKYNTKILSLAVPRTGVYWVMVRPDPLGDQWTRVSMEGLFNAYLGESVPLSTSGALYLTTSKKISMKIYSTQNEMEGTTMLSFVYLEGNTPLQLSGTHMAYTLEALEDAKTYGFDENVAFNSRFILLDEGNMYAKSSAEFNISVSGSYILSLRGDPSSGQHLKLQVYRNDQVAFTSFSQYGVCSGQAGVFNFKKGDKLYVRARYVRDVGINTMISIALLYTEG